MNDLDTLAQLGGELVTRGSDWRAYVPPLRVLYRHVRDGAAPPPGAWSLPHALAVAGMLGIGDAWPVLKRYSRCPRCPPPGTLTPWEAAALNVHRGNLPDRTGQECARCGFTWVEPHEPAVPFGLNTRPVHASAIATNEGGVHG